MLDIAWPEEDPRTVKIASHLAQWWSKFLLKPAIPDNGEKSETSFMASGLALLLQNKIKKPEVNKIDQFVNELTKIITLDLKRNLGHFLPWEPYTDLSVDYGPCRELVDAIEQAGIETRVACYFPWKTHTKALPSRVQVAQGYQAPRKIIFDLRTEMEKSWMAQQECLNWFSSAERDVIKWFEGGSEFVSADEYEESMQYNLQKAAEALRRI